MVPSAATCYHGKRKTERVWNQKYQQGKAASVSPRPKLLCITTEAACDTWMNHPRILFLSGCRLSENHLQTNWTEMSSSSIVCLSVTAWRSTNGPKATVNARTLMVCTNDCAVYAHAVLYAHLYFANDEILRTCHEQRSMRVRLCVVTAGRIKERVTVVMSAVG